MPTSWYWNEVIGTMLPPTVFEVLKVVTGIGTLSPITRLRLLALGDAQLRLGEELGVGVLLDEVVDEARGSVSTQLLWLRNSRSETPQPESPVPSPRRPEVERSG